MSEVILINLENFQDYILDNIEQLKSLKYNVTVIASNNLMEHFSIISNIKLICSTDLYDINFNYLSKLDSTFRNGFWKLCSLRLFYLYSYLKQYNITNAIHIENDVMLYDKIDNIDTSKVWVTMDSNNRCIPGIIFIPDYTKLDKLIFNYNHEKNDMDNIAIFFNNNRDICDSFPIIKQNYFYNNLDIFSNSFNKFNKIYDGAAIGQYLGGVDPRNIPGDSRGFINETCVVDYSKYNFIWKYNNSINLYQPYIIIDNIEIPIVNLHIHCKQLNRFLSTNPIENKLILMKEDEYLINKIMDSQEYISGEKFQSIANVYLGLYEDFNFNPNIICQSSKLLDISSINSQYYNPKIVFCYTHRLNILIEKIKFFANPFILISHNSDENIDERYEILLYSNKIIRWYGQNIKIKHPKLILLPIAIANSMWEHGNLEILKTNITTFLKKTKDFYFYFSVSTNKNERLICKQELENKGLIFGTGRDFSSYLNDLALHKFAICPSGNGIDCHRLWECFYLGVIPILLRCPFSEQLEEILPCILLDKWSDFDKDKLILEYNKLNERLKLNYKYLIFSYYKNSIENVKPKTVWFFPYGRSGNNIFQYLAGEVIKQIYNFDIVQLKSTNEHLIITEDLIEINDHRYTQIISEYLSNPQKIFSCDKDIILNGYFQKSDILLYLRPTLLKYFNRINYTFINNMYTISDFSRLETIHNIILDNDSLILHLRLDDYIHHNNPPNIFDKVELSKFIDTILFSKLYIVCDKINHNWEKVYIQYFIDKYNATILSASLIDDFNFLKLAKKLMISQSTYCWLAAYLGGAEEVYIPYSNYYKDQTILKECHDHCTIKYDIPFANDLT